MPYRFTAQARDDLRDIAAYTRDRWATRSAIAISLGCSRDASNWRKSRSYAGRTPTTRPIGAR